MAEIRSAQRPERGVRLPLAGGARSSSAFGTAVVADSLASVDPALADDVSGCSSWRRDYIGHLARSTELSASATASVGIARAGLEAAYRRAVLIGSDGVERPLEEWRRESSAASSFETATVSGSGEPLRRVEVPYRGETLAGAALERQLDRWVERGVMEVGFAESMKQVMAHPEWLPLPGHHVVLLGAGAAMGPLSWLSRWGASVTAVDLAVPGVWDRIRRTAEAGAGRLDAPVDGGGTPGAHLAAQLPSLRPWLAQRVPADGTTPVLGTYGYADGAAHVELTLAADVLAQDVAAREGGMLVYLNTPTDSFLVPERVFGQARDRARDSAWNGPLHRLGSLASGRRLFRPAYDTVLTAEDGTRWSVIDTLIGVQGPNYALAKRIQRWRGVVNRSEGRRTSSTVAPASWTHSVTKNRILAAVYGSAHRFGVEIFEAETSAALMAAKLVADAFAESVASSHPEALFSDTAVHGGLWRQPFDPRSALSVAAVLGAPRELTRRG